MGTWSFLGRGEVTDEGKNGVRKGEVRAPLRVQQTASEEEMVMGNGKMQNATRGKGVKKG